MREVGEICGTSLREFPRLRVGLLPPDDRITEIHNPPYCALSIPDAVEPDRYAVVPSGIQYFYDGSALLGLSL